MGGVPGADRGYWRGPLRASGADRGWRIARTVDMRVEARADPPMWQRWATDRVGCSACQAAQSVVTVPAQVSPRWFRACSVFRVVADNDPQLTVVAVAARS